LNSSGQGLILNRTINVAGTTTWNSIGVGGAGTWNNQSGALFDDVADNSWDVTFNNQAGATFRKSAGGGSATFFKPFTNAGTVQAQSGTLAFTGGFTQTGGSTVLAGGSISSNSLMNFTGGTLTGSGTLAASATFANASIAPGFAAGTLTVGGSLTLGAGSILDYELGSVSDLIIVNNNLTLDGTLNVAALSGFGPGTFTLIDYNGTLTDNGLDLGTLPGGFSYQIVNNIANTQINLQVSAVGVPEPATWIIIGSSALMAGCGGWTAWERMRRHRRRLPQARFLRPVT
jgi:fibronectin-binding autotransporter adhesin